MDKAAREKVAVIYDFIDNSNGFYRSHVAKESRSRMNIVFLILNDDKELTPKFVAEAAKEGLIQLAGHRSVGGLRASIYNGMPMDGVLKLRDFMQRFMAKYQNKPKL